MKAWIPYTYLIGWTAQNKWYYGCQWGGSLLSNNGRAHPDNLWKTYFTSGKYVHLFRAEHGDPDVVEVRKTFLEDPDAAREWERRVLERFRGDPRFLNANNGNPQYLVRKQRQ